MAKTVKIATIIDRANSFLLNSTDSAKAAREAIHAFTADLLLGADAYKGFRYLEPDDMKQSQHGKTAGIHFSGDGNHVYPDKSRTAFYGGN